MQSLFELIGEVFLAGLGALMKRVFGRPISESGISETWIGVVVVTAAVAILVLLMRSY
jgi:hypothetical protein